MLKNSHSFIAIFIFFSLMAFLPPFTPAQSSRRDAGQTRSEFERLIGKAEREQYNVLRIEFVGNESVTGRLLFRQAGIHVGEGDIFTRKNLNAALRELSKLKVIYPVHRKDVKAYLDEKQKTIDFIIQVREKPKKESGHAGYFVGSQVAPTFRVKA